MSKTIKKGSPIFVTVDDELDFFAYSKLDKVPKGEEYFIIIAGENLKTTSYICLPHAGTYSSTLKSLKSVNFGAWSNPLSMKKAAYLEMPEWSDVCWDQAFLKE